MTSILITGGTIVDPTGERRGDVRVADGRVAEVADTLLPHDGDEVLDAYLFQSIEQVQHITEEWLREYNEQRPHDALGGVPPRTFMPRLTTAADSSSGMST